MKLSGFSSNINKCIRLFIQILKCRMINYMEYRWNFFLGGIAEFIWMLVNFIFFNVVFLKIDEIGGWTKYEVLMLTVLMGLFDTIIAFFFHSSLVEVPQLINTGNLDFIILKPVNHRFYLSLRNVDFSQLINFVLNIGLIIYLANRLNLELSASKIIISILLIINGVFILYNLYFLIVCLAFWVVKVNLAFSVYYQLFYIGNKPINIYNKIVQKIFTFIIPIFIAFNYPVIYISKGLSIGQLMLSFVLSIVFFIITQLVFRFGLRNYSSASS